MEVEEFDCLHDEGKELYEIVKEKVANAVLLDNSGTFHAFDANYDAAISKKTLEARCDFLKDCFSLEDEEFPWTEVDEKLKGILEKRVKLEIVKSHNLFPIKDKLVAVATCEANDDTLFFYGDKYYMIHLTWANGNSDYPRYIVIDKDKIDEYLLRYEW